MKCKDCPARGYSWKNGKEILSCCCCACHPSTEVKGPEAECQYGIVDYTEYITGIREKYQNILKKGE